MPRTAKESGRLEREGVYVGWGTPGTGHYGLCTVITFLTDISQTPNVSAWKPSCRRLQGRQGGVGGRDGGKQH